MSLDTVLLAQTNLQLSDEQVRDLAVEMCVALGAESFLVVRGQFAQHALSRCEPDELEYVSVRDGGHIDNSAGDVFRVCLRTSYYGIDDEIGQWPEIANAARWLESRLPGTTMWYGDTSNYCVERFGPEERAVLWTHFAVTGIRPRGNYYVNPTPNLCRLCQIAMKHTQWLGRRTPTFYCSGCGYHLLKHSNGRVVLFRWDAHHGMDIATDDVKWAAYVQGLSGEEAISVAAEMCLTKKGLAEALTLGNTKVREYAMTHGIKATPVSRPASSPRPPTRR